MRRTTCPVRTRGDGCRHQRGPGGGHQFAGRRPCRRSPPLKVRIETALAAMSDAVTSTPAQQAAKVTKLAEAISELATNDLADGGRIVKQAEALVAKFNDSVATARKRSNDPNLRPAAREIYGQLLPGLEGELAKLLDAKLTVVRIRAELLRQAEGLRQSADAIGFAEHCNKLVLASQAFRATLAEAVKFAGNIASLIQSVGRGQPSSDSAAFPMGLRPGGRRPMRDNLATKK